MKVVTLLLHIELRGSRTTATSKIEYFVTIELHLGCYGWPRFSSLYKVARIRQQRNVEKLVKTRQQQSADQSDFNPKKQIKMTTCLSFAER